MLLALTLLLGQVEPIKSDDFKAEMQIQSVLATVRIKNLTTGDVGSGVILGQDGKKVHILTAAHVVGRGDELEVSLFSKESYPKPASTSKLVSLLDRDVVQDLAILQLATKETIAAEVKLCPLKKAPEGTKFPALSVGCTEGEAPKCKASIVADAKRVRRPREEIAVLVWEVTPAPIEGRSGGPLLDREGRLIGICSGVNDDRGYFAHLQAITKLLERNKDRICEFREKEKK